MAKQLVAIFLRMFAIFEMKKKIWHTNEYIETPSNLIWWERAKNQPADIVCDNKEIDSHRS